MNIVEPLAQRSRQGGRGAWRGSTASTSARWRAAGLRKKIADKMVRSKFTAPHYTFVEELDATGLVAMRAKLNESLAKSKDGTKLSFLPFFV